MLDLDLHFIDLGSLGIAFEGIYGTMLGLYGSIELLDLLLETQHQGMVVYLNIVLLEHPLHLLRPQHSINRKL